MAAPELNSTDFELPVRSFARPRKIQFRGDLSPTIEDDYFESYSSSDGANFLPNNSSRDSVFSLISASREQLQEDEEKACTDLILNGSLIDFDLEDLENVQICTITDIIVICQVHLQDDAKPLGYVTP